MALLVRNQTGEDEDRFVPRKAGDTRENGGFGATEGGQHPVVQPADDRAQAPQVMHPRPCRFGSPALGDGLGHARSAGGQNEAAAVRKHLGRQVAVAGHQVLGRVQGERLGLRVDREAQAGRSNGCSARTAVLRACGLESMQGRRAIVELGLEQRERWRRCRGRWSLAIVTLRSQKHRKQALAFVRLRRPALVEVGVGFPARDGLAGDFLLLVDVMDIHEHGGVADVPVRLLVLRHQHFQDAGITPNGRGWRSRSPGRRSAAWRSGRSGPPDRCAAGRPSGTTACRSESGGGTGSAG